ncbi:hypothetical protein CU097_005906, partial [Rhizopus azygosporus]
SVNPDRIASNFKDLELKQEDFDELNTLVHQQKANRMIDPYNFWGVDVFEEH